MASLGNIGVYHRPVCIEKSTEFAWATLYHSTATITGGTIGEVIHVFKDSVFGYRGMINSAGQSLIYDLEDGSYQVREISTDTHGWRIDVALGVVSITPYSYGGGGGASGTTKLYGFFGT